MAEQTRPSAAMLVIGDEILSGRTRDSNMHFLARELTRYGIQLLEVRMVPDRHDRIAEAVRALSRSHDVVFTSGGIGPTHDDITADAVADALDVAIDVRDDACAVLEAHYARTGTDLNDARLRMARIPEGARLIDNPVSAAPGFIIGNVHVMAGVPAIFEAMVAGVLPMLAHGTPILSQSLSVLRPEGDIAAPLKEMATRYADLSFGSYPFQRDGTYGTNIVVRGSDGPRLDAAVTELGALFTDDLSGA